MNVSCAFASDIDGAVSADGLNTNPDANIPSAVDEIESYNINMNNSVSNNLGSTANIGTFDDLDHDIRNLYIGAIYNVDKDYYYDDGDLVPAKYGIILNMDNVTIYGNGHIIDGMHKSVLFSIFGNNVKIYNLTFVNSYYEPKMTEYDNYSIKSSQSPVNWEGNNGLVSNCRFIGNSAPVMGGAVTWNGNEGLIENSIFENNIAGVIGGAIYCSGLNNTFRNCTYLNSTSTIYGEALYIERVNKNNQIFVFCTGDCMFINGTFSNIDVNYFNYVYEVLFAGETIDIIPLIYSAMISTKNCVQLNNSISYYGQYLGKEFIFTLVKDFGEGYIYEWDLHMSKVEDLNEVYKQLIKNDYKLDVTLYKDMIVRNKDDYELAVLTSTTYLCILDPFFIINDDIERFILQGGSIGEFFSVLNVIFENGITIDSKSTWDPASSGFSTINIEGHGSKIKTTSGKRDENKWATISAGYIFGDSDLTVTGFNTAFENMGGTCVFNNVRFDSNKMDYWVDRDWGAAILNAGVCICKNCIFTNNYCSNGGAIFNQGTLSLTQCYFKGNEAYRNGDNVLNVDKGNVTIDGEEVVGSKGCVKYIESADELQSVFLKFTCYTLSIMVGFIVSACTSNPLIGIGVGAAIGAALGTVCSIYLTMNTYDVNYNRLKTTILLIGGCTLCGALGGYLGSNLCSCPIADVEVL